MEIEFDVVLTGTSDQQLAMATVPLDTTGTAHVPKFDYELAFEDVLGNLFDQQGFLRNRRGMDLRWTLDNTFDKLRDGNPFPLAWHMVRIKSTDALFALRRTIRRLGL